MVSKVEKAELWILNLVIEARHPIGVLRTQRIGWHYETYHGLSNAELVPVLDGLFQRGDLYAFVSGPEEEEVEYVPSLQQIEALVLTTEQESDVFFGLTPQGGARWDAAFHPNWSCYVASDDPETEVVAGTQSVAEQHLVKCGVHAHLLVDAPQWDVVAPWEATYWGKVLPSGQRCRFRLTEEGRESVCWYVAEDWYNTPEQVGVFAPSPSPAE